MRRLVSNGRASVGIDRYVDDNLTKKLPISVEDLDAIIPAIRHVRVPRRICSNTVRRVELARFVARLPPRHQPVSALVDLGDTRIDVPVADVRILSGIPRYVGHLSKHPIHRRQWRLLMFQGTGPL